MALFSIEVAAWLVRIVLWTVLVVFGVWMYRRTRLRSMIWLEAYLLFYVPLSLAMTHWFSVSPNWIGDDKTFGPFGWSSGELISAWIDGRVLLESLIHLLLAVLILADVLYLLRRTGAELHWQPLHRLLRVRQHSRLLGTSLTSLMVVYLLVTSALLV